MGGFDHKRNLVDSNFFSASFMSLLCEINIVDWALFMDKAVPFNEVHGEACA